MFSALFTQLISTHSITTTTRGRIVFVAASSHGTLKMLDSGMTSTAAVTLLTTIG
jgi:hypothetical protein